jgi:membrane protease YdiL (CAAX protease family)
LIQSLIALLISSGFQLLLAFFAPETLINLVGEDAFNLFSYPPWLILWSAFTSTAAILFSVWFTGKYFDRRKLRDFGFNLDRRWWEEFWFGILLGTTLMGLIFVVEWAAGWISIQGFLTTTDSNQPLILSLLLPLIIFVSVGFNEELLSRGYQLTNISEGLAAKLLPPQLSRYAGALISAVLFSLYHALNPHMSWLGLINLFLAGILLAIPYLLTGQLAISIGFHISWNLVQGAVLGFPVSGSAPLPARLIDLQQAGPILWTGGKFGPEGGIIATITFFIGMIILVIFHRMRNKQLRLIHPPIPPNLSNNPSDDE